MQAEQESGEEIKEEEIKEEKIEKTLPEDRFDMESWQPKTKFGKMVKSGELKDIDIILDNGHKILEEEIVEALLPGMESELLLIGQSKGKFGGGARRVFKQTQKKTQEGNKPNFQTIAATGNKNGYVGIGGGKSRETVPAREKAMRKAKLNLIKIRRGCGSWQCGCKTPHSIPFKVEGKCGGARLTLLPAPKGTGLCIEGECQKILKLAGVKDIWSQTNGKNVTKINLITSLMQALEKLSSTRIQEQHNKELGIAEGRIEDKPETGLSGEFKTSSRTKPETGLSGEFKTSSRTKPETSVSAESETSSQTKEEQNGEK